MKKPLIKRESDVLLGRENKLPDILFTILLVLLTAASCLIFIRCTPSGVGLVSDSVNYINGARSIAAGHGYFRDSGGGTVKAITNFPPLYSIVLSLPLKLGMGWRSAVWWVSLVFFALNTVLIIRLVQLASGSRWAGLLAAVLFLAMKPYLYYQFYAMSEPVYYFCTLAAFILMVRGMRSANFFWWLGCGIACGCAFLARYIGIVSLCAVFGSILIFLRKNRGKAFAGLFGGSLPLIAAWLIRNALITGNASNRQVLSHWVTGEDLLHGILIIWRWIYPQRYGKIEVLAPWMVWVTAAFFALAVVFLIIVMILSLKRREPAPLPVVSVWTFLLFIIGYLMFVILTISLFDASVNIEERIIFPSFMVFFLTAAVCFGGLLSRREILPAAPLFAALVFFAVVFGMDSSMHVPEMAEAGYGWGWEGWDKSPAMNIIRALPEDKIIYTNQIEAVSLWAGRGAYALLDPIDPSSEQEREGYRETMEEIRRQVFYGESVLVFFGVQDLIGGEGSWVTELCDDLPFIYKDTSEWVVGETGRVHG